MKIKTNQSKQYRSAHEALLDEGFEFDGKHQLYKKNGEWFEYQSMDHFNTTIYSIEMKKVKQPLAWNEYK